MRKEGEAVSCYTCLHRDSHEEIESWEMPHIRWMEHSCAERPSISNLKQFPFAKTNCPKWKGEQHG
jgi:hypothetical protein